MPTYVYQCRDCETRSEVFQKMTDDPLTTCEECGGSIRRVLQPVGIVFKGSGFYVTDYKRAESGSNGKSADSTSGKSEGGDTKPAAEKKSETKETTKAAATAAA